MTTEQSDLVLVSERRPGYEKALERLLDSIGGLNWNLEVLQTLDSAADLINRSSYLNRLIKELNAASEMVDIRVRRTFFELITASFDHLASLEDRIEVIFFYFEMYGRSTFFMFDESAFKELENDINESCFVSSDSDRNQMISEVSNRLAWFFFKDFRRTILRLFRLALDNESVVIFISTVNFVLFFLV